MVIEVMEEGGENPPRSVQFVIPHKVTMIALEGVKEERFVRFGYIQVRETTPICQIKLESVTILGAQTRRRSRKG